MKYQKSLVPRFFFPDEKKIPASTVLHRGEGGGGGDSLLSLDN